jgi:hypothetical protein
LSVPSSTKSDISSKFDLCQNNKFFSFFFQATLVLPAKARVIKDRIPSLYDKRSLRLQIGDLLLVNRAESNGQCEGTLIKSNRQGTFPFTYVEFLDDENDKINQE